MQTSTGRLPAGPVRLRAVMWVVATLCLLGLHPESLAFGIVRESASGDFYISNQIGSNNVGGMYVAYAITNDTGVAETDVWVEIDSFTGGVVGLGVNEDGRQQLGAMAPGETRMAYLYLTATATTTTPQGHTVRVYDGRPGLAGVTELDNTTFSFTGVDDSISASSNKVDIIVSGPDPASVGGIVTMQVEGRTGTVGSGSNLELTPAGDLDWPADTFQLVSSEITFTNIQGSNCGGTTLDTFTDELEIVWGQTSCYVAIYRFVAVDTTTAPTAVSPIIHVASGNQIKHTDTSGFAALPPLAPPRNFLTLEKWANPEQLTDGGTSTYTLTLTNTASNAFCPASEPTCNDLTVEEFEDSLPTTPAAVSYDTGSSEYQAVSIGDPIQSSNVLSWVGTFSVPAGGTASLTYDITLPDIAGVYTNTAVARIGAFLIDATNDLSNVPATTDVIVGTLTPLLGVSKDASVTGTGPFAVTLDFYLENFGNVALSEVQVTDDLDAAFGAGNYSITTGPTVVADPGGGLTTSGTFNGSGDTSLLATGSTLGIGQTAQLRLVVSVTATGSYTNSATAGGDPPSGSGNRVTDTSVDGTDPDPTNDDDPTDDTGTTPIDLAETALIGVSKDASITGSGPFAVTLDFYLENFGNVALSEVQVTDDLDAAFGAGNYSITTGPTIVSDPGGGLTANAAFNGSGDTSLLATGSSLSVGQTAQLRLVVSVTATGSYTNSATAGGDPPSGSGNRVTDTSVDGTDPDPTNDDDPTDDTGTTPIDLAETALIGVSKDASITGSGPFAVTLDFYLENFGNVALSEVQVTDDLDAAFGAGNYSITTGPTIVSDPGGGLTANAAFNGSGDTSLLATGSTLGIGQTAQLRLVVSVTATGSYTNSATAGGDPPSGSGNRVTDTSVDGTDPDPTNDDDPTDDTGTTPIDLAETASIGVSKDASVTGAGPFAVTLDFYLENFGNVSLSEVQVTDDLDAAFGAGNYSITTGPTIVSDPGGGLTTNAAFNGSGDTSLLATGSTLGIGQTAQLRLVVSVTAPGSYTNSATAGGDPPSGPTNRVTDTSVDGTDPDPTNDDDPTDDTGTTPISLAEIPLLGVSKDASVTGSGPFAVTLDFYLENFGNVALSEVQVTDDLDAAFGAGNYSITTGPTVIADPGGGLTINGAFNGSGDTSLLATGSTLGIGQTAQLRLVVSVTAPGSYTNSATAGGDPPSGPTNRVTDTSVDGTDPDPTNDDDPTDDTGTTPISLAEIPLLGVSKDASVTGSGPFAVTLDFYLENFGNVALSEVQVTDDLDAAFGAGNYSITTGPTVVADPGGGLTTSGTFNGSGDTSLLATGSTLGIGQTAQLRLVVSVTAPGSYTNSATAGGDPPSGPTNRVTDTSVDGTDPDPTNDDDPTDDTGTTPISLAEIPLLGVSKDASVTGSGPFAVTLDFYLENFGNVALSEVQVTDDLDAAFGAGNYSITTGPTVVADPGGGLTINGAFNGSGDTSLLATGSTLGIGQTAQLRLVVSVTATGSYTNSATAGGDPPSGSGNRVTDTSVDGTDPDPTNDDDPTDDTGTTPIDLAETPSIGVSKDASITGSGPFAVTLDFYLENFGNVALSEVQVTDDLDAAFGAGNYSITTGPTVVADPGGGLTINGAFNGSGDTSLLATGSTLGIGQTAQLRLVVSVTATGSYTNSATAGGDPPSGPGNRVTDTSVDGADPDPTNDDDPTDDTGTTPIDLAETALIGVSKDASVTGSGPFAVTLDFYLENFGNVALSEVQVTDDLDAAFGAGNYSITTGPTVVADPGGGLTINGAFNGSGDTSLLATGSTLGIGQTAQLRLVVSVTATGSYTNSATAGGDPPSGPGNRVTDTSVDGTDPDPTNDDDPTDDTGTTPIDLAETPSIGVSKDASITGSGPFAVTLDFYLENFGNVALSEVQVTDDLDAAFGAGNYSITTGPTIVSDPGGGLTANAAFNGSGDTSLLATGSSLSVGQTAQLRLVVSVTATGSYTNSATAGGDPPSGSGNRVTDTSVDGTDPDPTNDDDPTDDTGTTPIDLAETALIGVSKDASVTGSGPFAVTLDFYLENFGNVALSEVQVNDDLDAAFGAGNYSITTGPTIVSDPGGGLTANAAFNGSGDTSLLATGSSLSVGQTAQVRLVVSVTATGSYTNSATAGGDPPSGSGNRVTDTSVDGTDPDPTNDDDPTDDTGTTPIDLAETPSIGVSKDASVTGSGPFAVTLDFYLENFGNVALSEVQVTDDLDAAFGAGNYSIATAPTIVSDPGGGLTANAAFNGSGDTSLLATGSSLSVGQTAQLRLVVSVTATGSYTNSATAGGNPPSGPGNRVTDTSVDGADPDPSNNDDPSDDSGVTPIGLAETPSIGVSKDASVTGAGPFAVTLDFYLENFGNVALSEVQVTDDLDAAFGAGNYSITAGPTVVADPGGGLTANGGFNGSGDTSLLATGSSLAVGQTAQLRVVVSVTAPGSYTNSAIAGGDPPSGPGNRVTDSSVDGADPDPTNNDDPSDDSGVTPIGLAETPSIGVSKDASVTGAGPFAVTLDFYLENFGNVALSEVQVTDDLDAAFGAGNYSITNGPTVVADPGGGLTANGAFNGSGNTSLLAAGSSLSVGQTAQLRLVVSVTAPGSYTNSATAGGDPPSGSGNRVTDTSIDGTDPDPTDNDDPSDDTGTTPIGLTETPSIGVSKAASITGAGPFAVTLDFYLENFGNVALSEVQVTDDLDAAFGAGNYSITTGPTVVADPGGGLTANGGFNGSGDTSLLAAGSSLSVGQTAQLRLVVSVTAPGSYTNSATAGGDPPSGPGNRVTDTSVDGADPDPSNNDDPSDDSGVTPIGLAETPSIGVSKDASVTGAGPFAVTLDFYLENFGNVALSEVQVTDDLDAAFGAGNYGITTGPTIVSDPGGGLTANGGFNGSGDTSLLATGSSLAVGQTAQLRVVVSITAPGSYTNSATAGGDPPSGPGNRVTDTSVDGADPDPSNNDDPSDDSGVTPIGLAETPSIGVSKDASVTGAGPFAVTLDFYLENFGNVALSEVQVTDDLDAAFGAGNYGITTGPTIVSDPGGGLTANSAFNGSGDTSLLATGSTLGIGQTAQLRLVVSVTAPGSYTNSATAGGNPPSGPGNRVTDTSVDGADPDPTDNDDPSDDSGVTPIGMAQGDVLLSKSSDRSTVSVGGLIGYTLTASNSGVAGVTGMRIEDTPPAGFDYVAGSATLRRAGLDGVLETADDVVTDIVPSSLAPLEIVGLDLAVGESLSVSYLLRVGSGVVNGEHVNTARVTDSGGSPIGEDASAVVSVVQDALFDRTGILGRVFHDLNGDGWQDEDEPGVPGVRLTTVLGLRVETDSLGRYHLADVDGGRIERGRNFILKLDTSTLPPGAQLTTENPRVLRITRGLHNRIDFGVRFPSSGLRGRRTEAILEELHFAPDSAKIVESERARLERVAATVGEATAGELTITGHTQQRVAQRRSEARSYTVTPRFAQLEATLREEDRRELERIAAEWRQAREVHVEVVGHTSNVPIASRSRHLFPDNYALSEARAQVIADFLAEHLGIDDEHITVIGRGPDEPVSDNATAEGRAANRRTDVRISGSIELAETASGEGYDARLDLELSRERARTVAEALHVPPVVRVDTVGRGHEAPRASNESEAGRADNRRVEILGSVHTDLPVAGQLWLTEDPLVAEPRLNIEGPARVEVRDGRPASPVEFRASGNYDAFIDRWELRIYRSDDVDETKPLAMLSGKGGVDGRAIRWDGSVEESFAGPTELAYVLRVFDERGNYDETAPAHFFLSTELHTPEPERSAADPVNRLARRGIMVDGSRVRIHGTGLPGDEIVVVDGSDVVTTADGSLSHELLLPPGAHEIEVVLRSASGATSRRVLPVEVRDSHVQLVGIADLTIGQNSLSGNLEPVATDEHYDGELFVDGRIALSLKGKIRGRYLIAARLDTGESEIEDMLRNLDDEDPRQVFRHLDPDAYYPIYGDDSTTIEDGPSQGRFFVRLDWDKSSALWGNFNTGLTGSEFSRYNRSLYGAKLDYRAPSATEHGDDRGRITAFVSPMQTASAHNEFAATGGSLYYLRDTDIVVGSEKVAVEIRDRDSRLVVANHPLRRGRDYEVDELQGRIVLARPLSQIAQQASPSIVKDEPLDGNPVVLLVDYEYRTAQIDEELTTGARGQRWLGDHLSLGGTYVSESRAGQDYELHGIDVALRHDAGTFVKVEYAESQATQADGWFSSDGGLSFQPGSTSASPATREGEVLAVEGRMRLDELTESGRDAEVALWWRDRDAGFSSARADTGIPTTEYGAEASLEAGSRIDVSARLAVVERDGVGDEETLSLQARAALAEALELAVEGRRVEETPATGADRSGTLVAARLGYDVGPQASLYAALQASVEEQGDYSANDRATLGARLRLASALALHVEASAGDRGDALRVGADYRLDDRNTLYGSYTLSADRTDSRRDAFVLGQRSRLSSRLDVFSEGQFTQRPDEAGLGHVVGLDYRLDGWIAGLSIQDSALERGVLADQEREAYGLWVGRRADALDWDVRLERRNEDGSLRSRQSLASTRFDYRASESLRVFGKLNLSETDGNTGDPDRASFTEGTLGVSYRPDRWNVLGRFTVLHDLPGEAQRASRPDQRSEVLSVDVLHRLHRRWSLGGKLAHRSSEVRAMRDRGEWFEADARLIVLRSRYHIVSRWDGLAEVRRLWSEQADDARTGLLLGVDRHLGEHVKLGVGYNFTDFTDDLTDIGYDGSGWFINVVGKY